MGKIIEFGPSKKLDKTALDLIIQELQKVDPTRTTSIFIYLGLESEEGERSTYSAHRGLDFYDLGFLTGYIDLLNNETILSHITSEDTDEVHESLKDFQKDEESETDDE